MKEIEIAPEYNDVTPASPIDEKAMDDLTFAEKYLKGEATDSLGNRIDGTNAKFPTLGPQTLLGPVEIEHGPAPDLQSHMDPALLGTNDTLGNPTLVVEAPTAGVTRSGSPLANGISQDNYAAMMRSWNRSGGGPSEADQEIASRRAAQNIRNSFPRRG